MESEIVSLDQMMPEVCWIFNVLEVQGHPVDFSEFFQDNICTQLLVVNGKLSSLKRTKNIKSKIFYVKDKVEEGSVKITGYKLKLCGQM